MAVKFLTGKDYPNLCSSCQKVITDAAQLLTETEPETENTEAPIMYAYHNRLFCGGHCCLDPEYNFKGVRAVLDTYRTTESSVAAFKVAREMNPQSSVEVIDKLLQRLKGAYQIEDKAPERRVPERPDDEPPISVAVRPVATYDIISEWVDRLVAFGKIKEVEDGAIRRADIEELNASLLADFRSRNPHLELLEL